MAAAEVRSDTSVGITSHVLVETFLKKQPVGHPGVSVVRAQRQTTRCEPVQDIVHSDVAKVGRHDVGEFSGHVHDVVFFVLLSHSPHDMRGRRLLLRRLLWRMLHLAIGHVERTVERSEVYSKVPCNRTT